MKHIKPFNEANVTGQFLTDLREFCEMNLVYLMDDGLQVSVSKASNVLIYVSLSTYKMRWLGLSDYVIPLFTRLSSNYNIFKSEVHFNLGRVSGINPVYMVNDIISDTINLRESDYINSISFYIKVGGSDINDIGSRIKKFLGFNESMFNSDDLQDFCDTYLAYLLDDGFKVVIDNKPEDLFTIRLTQSSDNGNWLERYFKYDNPFIWDSIKDHYVPFLHMLSRNYKISDFAGNKQIFVITGDHRHQNKLFDLSDVLSGKSDQQLSEMIMGSIIVGVSAYGLSGPERLRSSGIVESVKSSTDEVNDFAEDCLAYLLDDGFEITTYTMAHNDRSAVIWIDKPGTPVGWNMKKTRIGFEWDAVKDYYIPFVQMLAKRYQLARFEQVRGVDYPVRFNYGMDSLDLEDFTYEQIVGDDLFLPEQGKEMLPYKVTKRGFAAWEKIYTIGVRVNLL